MMARKLMIVLMLAFFAVSCGKDSNDSKISRAEAIVEENPDSALQILSEIEPSTLKRGKQYARYAVAKTNAEYLSYSPAFNDSLLKTSADYFKNDKKSREKMMYLYLSAVTNINSGEYPEALLKSLEALEIADGNEDYLYSGRISRMMGDIYTKFFNTPQALTHYKNALESFRKSGNQNLAGWALHDMARAYNNNNQKQRAIETYDSCIVIAKRIGDAALLSESKRFKAYTLQEAQQYRESVDLLLSVGDKLNAKDAYTLANAYIGLEMPDSANYYYSLLQSLDGNNPETEYRILKYQGKYKAALDALENTYNNNIDTIWTLFGKNVNGVENVFYAGKVAKEESGKRNAIFYGITAFLILLSLSLAVYMNMRRRMKEMEADFMRLSLAMQETQDEVAAAETPEPANDNKEILLQRTFADIRDICDEIYLCSRRDNVSEKVFKRIRTILDKYRNSEEFLATLEEDVNIVYDDVVARFKHDLPETYNRYLRLFLYMTIGLDSRTIPILMDISQKTYYNKKNLLVDEIRKSESPHKSEFLKYLRAKE